jgi:hypothetical protein
MPFPAECPICKTVLAFPEVSPSDPVRCPSCNSRFIIDGRRVAHLSFTDYYAFLGLAPNADIAEIRKTVRTKILEHHPDHNPNDPKAADRLREVIQAKELLTDSEKRRIYDGVYSAKALPRWSQPRPLGIQMPSETRRRPDYYQTERRRDSRYEQILTQARNRSTRAPNENIDHLIEEIESIFASRGIDVNLRRGRVSPQEIRRATWGLRGAVFLGAACFIFGLFRGTLPGAVLLSITGMVIGWILGSSASSLVALAFLAGRVLLVGFFIGALTVAFTGSIPIFGRYLGTIAGLTLSGLAGTAILGLFRLGAGALSGRRHASLRYEIVREGTLGAWLGGLIALGVIYASTQGADTIALPWFALFSFYLLLDSYLFSRPWLVLY